VKRTVIAIATSLFFVKTVKEVTSLAKSKWNLESYLLGKQIDRAERSNKKSLRRHRRNVHVPVTGHNVMTGNGQRGLSGHNVTFERDATDSLNYHQAIYG